MIVIAVGCTVSRIEAGKQALDVTEIEDLAEVLRWLAIVRLSASSAAPSPMCRQYLNVAESVRPCCRGRR
jgi:hypothetical protein